eukprot:gene5611-5576_t
MWSMLIDICKVELTVLEDPYERANSFMRNQRQFPKCFLRDGRSITFRGGALTEDHFPQPYKGKLFVGEANEDQQLKFLTEQKQKLASQLQQISTRKTAAEQDTKTVAVRSKQN